MHPSRPLQDSNYGVRSIDSSFSSSADEDEGEEDERASSSSSGSTIHPTTAIDPPSLPRSTSPVPISYKDDSRDTSTPPAPPPAILSALPRDVPFVVARPPASLPLAPLPLLLSSTSSPVSLSPPLSPINSYTSSVSSSSPPTMTNYLSDSVSSLGSLENDAVEGVLDGSLTTSQAPSDDGRRSTRQARNDIVGGSNGNLVLPMWSSAEEDEVERELREADEAGGEDAGKHDPLRIIVLAQGAAQSQALTERLAIELGISDLEEGSAGNEDGKAGRWGTIRGGENELSRRVWTTTSENDLTSINRLVEDTRGRHALLARQLAPHPEALSWRDVYDLAATGKGRGQEGWIDCCLVAVEEDSPQQGLTAARMLSYYVPTLVVLLRSVEPARQTLAPELTGLLARLELVCPSMRPSKTSSDRLVVLDRASLSPTKPDETDGGLPTPQPGMSTDDSPFFLQQEGTSQVATFAQGVQTLFGTRQGAMYLHRLAARGFMRSRAALSGPVVVVSGPAESVSSSDAASDVRYPPYRRYRTSTPGGARSEAGDDTGDPPFDPLHFPSAVATLFVPTLQTLATILLEGMIGILSVVATSLLAGVVGEVSRRLDLRGAFGRRARLWR